MNSVFKISTWKTPGMTICHTPGVCLYILYIFRFGKSDYFSSVAAFFFSATLTAFATPPPTTQLIGISSAPLIPQNATANINRFAPVAFMLCRYSV